MRAFKRLLQCMAWMLGLLGLLLVSLSQAQAATYTFRSDTFSWESSANTIAWDKTCTAYPVDDDKATITFTGGFTFPFAGTARSSVRVFSNGMLQFGADTGFFRNFTNSTLPAGAASARSGCTAAATTLTLMAYWADLDPGAAGSGGVTWEQKGTAPNRFVVVTWNAVYQYNTATPYTFQVILFENGDFKYQYGNANASGSNATIGVQVNTTDYTLYAYNSGYNANGTAIRWVVPSATPVRVAEYQLDQFVLTGATGEAIDSSGSGYHGARVGSAASTATGYLCRSVDIPANTTTAASAIDTTLGVSSAVGTKGSISMWFRSNVLWTTTTAAMLFDATTSASRPFYLMRSSGGALRLAVADSAGTIVAATSAVNNIAANTWTHVTATWRLAAGTNQSTVRIFVNGALAASTSATTTGSPDSGLASLYLGDNRSGVTPSGGSVNSANGLIDEARIYNYDQGAGDIAIDMAVTHACLPPVDHYEVVLPSTSIACLGSTITVNACANSSSPCTARASGLLGQTATLSTSAAALGSPLLVFDSNGSASTTLSFPTATNGTPVSVSLSNEQSAATGARQCCPDGTACTVSNSCSTTFNTAGFIIAASANGSEATLPAQSAGTASATHFLRAVRSGSSTKACEAALTGANTVDWASQCNNPSTCSTGNRMTIAATASGSATANPASGVTAYGSVAMTFDSAGNAPFTFSYADVGQASLFVRRLGAGLQTTALTGRSNAYVTRPARFAVAGVQQTAAPGLTNPGATSASGAAFVKAGENFSASVSALTSAGAVAPNYGRETSPEGVLLTPTLVLPSGGATGTLGNGSIAGGSFSGGVATVTTLSFSEVGIITLAATVADGDYLGAGTVAGVVSAQIGRFVPARFALSGTSVVHRAALSCAPASVFTYLGENFRLGFTITAQNTTGATTQNYTGSFTKFDPTAASGWNLIGRDGSTVFSGASGRLSLGSASGSWSNGVASGVTLSANASRATSPDGPFSAVFGVAPTDSDGVAMAAFDTASISGGSNDRSTVGTLALRFGRLRLANAIGPADRALALPVAAQHWTGSSFDTNTLDSCTLLPTSTFSFGNLRRTLTAADTSASAAITLTAGTGKLTLAAPTAGRRGTYDIALSLGSTSTDASCLQPWTPGTGDAASAGANLAYLRGAWCGSGYDKDPAARATFGLQRGNETQVYRREMY